MIDMDKLVWHLEFIEEWNLVIKEKIEELNSRIRELDQQNFVMRREIAETLADMDIMKVRGKADTSEYCDMENKMIRLVNTYNDYKARYNATKRALKDAISSYEFLAEEINAIQKN